MDGYLPVVHELMPCDVKKMSDGRIVAMINLMDSNRPHDAVYGQVAYDLGLRRWSCSANRRRENSGTVYAAFFMEA